MVTYYVKQGEVYKVSATVNCDVYDGNGELILTCPAASIITFNAPTTKVSLSDDNAVISCISEVSGDLSGLTEHLNNSAVHVTYDKQSKWNQTSTTVETEIPKLTSDAKNLGTTVNTHVESDSLHVTDAECQKWNDAHSHTSRTDVHITTSERQTWNGKANGTHAHSISDIQNLQSTLDGKASTSLDVGVKRIDYGTGRGEGVELHDVSKTLTDASSFSDYKEYKATKDVCLIYTVSNSPGSGYTSDFNGFYYNYPLKFWMNIKVDGSYRLCEAACRRVCSGGVDFIEVHLKAGDEVQFYTASVGNYSGYLRVRLLEFNYR